MATYSTSFSGDNNQGLQVGGCTNGTIGPIIFNYKANDNCLKDCLKDLYLTDPRIDKSRIKNDKGGLLEGSYKWILDHDDFRRWRDDDQSRLLWIKGDPGKGKTMLLIGIVDELERQLTQLKHAEQSTSHATVLSYFFCQGTDSSLNNATAVLRGLIFLLAVQQPSLALHLREKYQHSGTKLFEGANAFVALSEILSGMLRDPSLARAYIVIDALDECETGLLQQLLKLIVQNTSASRVKWIVSSRNRRDIEQQLKLDDSQTRLSLELKANAEHVSHAVGVYIDDKVSQLESLQDDDALRDQVRHVLRHKATGTFLWVALVVQELKTAESWDVLDVLEEMPMGLEELYGRMLKQIQQLKRRDPELCRLVLSAATLAYRPLHILELGMLSGLPGEISGKSERVQTIIRMCGSFLSMRDDRVFIIHQSAKDYLSDKAATTIFPSGQAEAHRDIFLRSIHAMRKLRRDIYGLRQPGFSIHDLKIPVPDPLASVRYSCVYWVDHLCDARYRDDLVDGGPVHKFFEGYLLYWIEALSLSGAIPDAVHAVGNLERLLKTVSSESSLLSLTLDAHRFLLHHGLAIKNAPLQTYVSALLFSPTHSLMRELFKEEAPQWVLTGPTVDERWSPLVRTLEGHGHWVRSIAFSPDGKLIASGSGDETIKVWDAATGEVRHTLQSHGHWVRSIAFSPDGKLIASATADTTIKVWDTAKGEVKRTLEGHGHWVRSVAFSPDGKLIATGSWDRTIKVWDAAMGEVKHTLKGHGRSVESVAFSPDGKLIASGSNDWTIKVWDSATGEVKRTLQSHGGPVDSVAFSPDGNLIASGLVNGTVKVWDAATGEVKHPPKGYRAVYSVSSDTTGLYLFTDIGSIKLDAVTPINTKGPIQSQSQSQTQEAQRCGYGLSPDKSWITWNGHKALWLPPEYRPSISLVWRSVPPSTVARVAIGCSSGRVIVIGFSGPPPGLPSS
ncbi:hypothetical protein FSOLCH5_015252 [Fusarium solani]